MADTPDNPKIIHMIKGIFFEKKFELWTEPAPGLGMKVTTGNRTEGTIFVGVIWAPQKDNGAEGIMHDHYGYAELTDARMTQDSISFLKKHRGKSRGIRCTFSRREDGIWLGDWCEVSPIPLNKGIAWCTITAVDDCV